jgi:lysophospholipase L1-like esterase
MRVVCFGDSVLWGQGLPGKHKYAYQVFEALADAQYAGRDSPMNARDLRMFAHSGAVIGARTQVLMRARAPLVALVRLIFALRVVPAWLEGTLGGEISGPQPAVLQQVAAFDGDGAAVDLVLVNGGGNDIGALWYMLPTTRLSTLRRRIERHCHQDMALVLKEVVRKFPHACIVVPGYLQSLSEASAKGALGHYFARQLIFFAWRWQWVLDRVFERNRFFREKTAEQLALAVGEANVGAGGRVIFVEAQGCQPENAANARRPWVWGIDPRELRPQDPLRDFRLGACTRLGRWSPWYWSSFGHPNQVGARKIADAILVGLASMAGRNGDPRFDNLCKWASAAAAARGLSAGSVGTE